MDMQTKAILITGKPPFRKETELIINENNYPGLNLGQEFTVFTEHTQAKIRLLSNNPSTYLAIEIHDKEELTYIYPDGKEYLLSSGQEDESMIVPGYYEISIHDSGKSYYGFYKVKPSTISWEGLMKLRDYLENLLNGLAQNLYIKNMSKQGEYSLRDRNLLEMYKHIVNNEYMLINNIDSLVKDPITNIAKEYREQPYSRSPDMKSQRWLSKKGVTINSNSYLPEVNYEKHSVLSVGTIENRWIKKILHHTIHVIVELENAYSKIYVRITEEINSKEIEHDKALIKYGNIVNQKYMSKRWEYGLEQRVKILREEIDGYNKRLEFIQGILQNLKRIKTALAHYMYETWLVEITGYEKVCKPSLKLIREHRCLQIYTFHKKLLTIEKNQHGGKTSFPFKNTSLLFEYYTVAVVINILDSLGYEWKRGWLADSIDPMIFNGELPRETEMIFTKNDHYIELVYDREVNTVTDNFRRSQIVNINSKHTRPDVKMTVYSNETDRLLGCIIIEVKCSKTRYIYNKNGETKTIEQIKDYINFGHYYADNRSYLSGGVNKVILVYPKQRLSVNYPTGFNFSFIQLDPADEEGGYEQLRKELELFFGQF